ncbi:MAG TPA: MnhB domain-containing protein [Actinomycetota bacterium]|nr:MnhB domain-containing protein [Actinomycetota bacterium]
MTASGRRRLVLIGGAGLAALYVWAIFGLPDFGHYRGPYGDIINRVATPERHLTDTVTGVNFDYRGFDTINEEMILFAAVVGLTIILRAQRDEQESQGDEDHARWRIAPHTSDSIRVLGLLLVGPIVLFGIYIVIHAHLSPGGGFQGGVILATALLHVYLAGEYVTAKRLTPEAVIEATEATGAGGFVVIGLAGLIFARWFLENFFPLGTTGQLISAGTIPLINVSVGLAVTAGFVLILAEFMEQTVVLRRRSQT